MNTSELFLVLHNDYLTTHIGLFNAHSCIDSITLNNQETSKNLLPAIEQLLKRHTITLYDLHFLAAHQGPGPFTTLRVAIATINGLAFATQLPLIGVDGLTTFITEQQSQSNDYTIALLNAFCNEVYYAISTTATGEIEKGCSSIDTALEKIKNLPGKSIKLIGNGVQLYLTQIGILLKEKKLVIPQPLAQTASLQSIGAQAYEQWQKKENIVTQILPLYLKQYRPHTSA